MTADRSLTTKQSGLLGLALAVSVALASAAAAAWYQNYNNKNNNQHKEHSNGSTTKKDPLVNPSGQAPILLFTSFEQAAARIRKEENAENLSTDEKLVLYALYKQTIQGNAPAVFVPNSWNIMADQAKHAAWSKLRNMTAESAAAHYIHAVTQLLLNDDNNDVHTTNGSGSVGDGSNGFAHSVSRPAILEDEPVDGSGSNLDCSLESQLLAAAGQAHLDKIRDLLTLQHVDVNHQDDTGQSALHLAADQGHEACVQFLLEQGADLHAKDHDGIGVLLAAVIAGQVGTCRILLQHGADADASDDDGDTPRSCAQDDGSSAMKRLFVVPPPASHQRHEEDA